MLPNPSASTAGIGGVIAGIPVGRGPCAIALDTTTGDLFVANSYSHTVSVIDGATNKVVRTFSVPSNAQGIAFDSANHDVYVVVYASPTGYVLALNATSGSVTANISVGSGATSIAFDTTNGWLFVTNNFGSSVSVINGSTNRVVATIALGAGPRGIVYDPANGDLYVTDWGAQTVNGNVTAINGAKATVIATIQIGLYPGALAYDSVHRLVYALESSTSYNTSGTVVAINTSTNKVQFTMPVGNFPFGAAFDPTNGLLYVSDAESNRTMAIDPTVQRVVGQVEVGEVPCATTFDSTNGYLYISDLYGNNVSVLDPAAQTYPVTFNETGLGTTAQNSTYWSVTLSNSAFNGTLSNHTGKLAGIGFSLPKGTYNFTAESWSSNYAVLTKAGSFVIPRVGGNITIRFAPQYTVTFVAFGLSSYPSWTVTFNGQSVTSVPTNSRVIEFWATNGRYFYGVTPPSGDTASPSNGTVVVASGNVIVNVTFSNQAPAAKFTIQITESGLATGTNWSAEFNLTNSTSNGVVRSSTTTRMFFYTNTSGTYDWLVRPVSGYSCTGCNGTLTFAPGPGYTTYGEAVGFNSSTPSPATYKVGFHESGLPSGASWAVLLGAKTHSSTSNAISFQEPNGTYKYWAGNASGYNASPANGSVKVNGGPVNVTIQFSAAKTNGSGLRILTFTVQPSSLPVGATATVTVVTSGGVAPLHYAYTGFPVACSPPDAASWSCVPTATGGSTVGVTVTDARGAHVSTTNSLQVTPGSKSPRSGLGPAELRTYGVGIGVVAILIVVALVALVSRRSRASTDHAEAGESDPYYSAARNVRSPPDEGAAGDSRPGGGTTGDPGATDELSGLV